MTKTRPSTECGSDHQLLLAKLNIKFRQKKGRSVPVRYDTETIPQDCMVAAKIKFSALGRGERGCKYRSKEAHQGKKEPAACMANK